MATRTRVSSFTFLLIFSFLLLKLEIVNSVENPIKTIVVLVMENRSFDHMLGWMKKLNPEIDGVDGSESNPLSVTDPNSQKFFFKDTSHYVDPDPGHSFQAIREQIFGSEDTSADPAPMNGFAQQAYSMDNTTKMTESVMNGFEPDKVAVYKTLVSEFAVFDRWFASVPSSTQPNRLFVHSGPPPRPGTRAATTPISGGNRTSPEALFGLKKSRRTTRHGRKTRLHTRYLPIRRPSSTLAGTVLVLLSG